MATTEKKHQALTDEQNRWADLAAAARRDEQRAREAAEAFERLATAARARDLDAIRRLARAA